MFFLYILDVSEDSGVKTKLCSSPEAQKSKSPLVLPPIGTHTILFWTNLKENCIVSSEKFAFRVKLPNESGIFKIPYCDK